MQPPTLQLNRAPSLHPPRETSQHSFLTRTRSAVRDRLRGALDPEAGSTRAEGTELTVGTFLEAWLTEVARVTVRPRTYVSYRYVVGLHLVPALGDLVLAALSPADVQAFLNAKSASGLSPRTVGYLRGVLRGALGHAERTDLVTRNVARLARPPRIPRRRVSPLSVEQVRTFVAAIAGDRLEALYLVALGVGLRQGEILGLRWSDVDLDGGTLTVRHALARIDGRGHLGRTGQVLAVATDRDHGIASAPTPISAPSTRPAPLTGTPSRSNRGAGPIPAPLTAAARPSPAGVRRWSSRSGHKLARSARPSPSVFLRGLDPFDP